MSITEHVSDSKKEIEENPKINNVWELLAAICYRFGLGAGAVLALVITLAYGTSLIWEDRIKVHDELQASNNQLTEYLISSSAAKADLAAKMTAALTEANAAARETSRTNDRLAGAIEQLTVEIHRDRTR